MKCRRCHARAVVSLPSHNTAFCPDCFLDFFSKQVDRGIREQGLMTKDDRVLVALSGGKDSLALMLELGRQGYDVTALHIDLGIPGSSPAARGVVERFCKKYDFPLSSRGEARGGPRHSRREGRAAPSRVLRLRQDKALLLQSDRARRRLQRAGHRTQPRR